MFHDVKTYQTEVMSVGIAAPARVGGISCIARTTPSRMRATTVTV
jgi:hypothetical protein